VIQPARCLDDRERRELLGHPARLNADREASSPCPRIRFRPDAPARVSSVKTSCPARRPESERWTGVRGGRHRACESPRAQKVVESTSDSIPSLSRSFRRPLAVAQV
jgi:hypothetical protein